MTDWTKAYQALAKAGYSDSQIAQISGVTRSTVNKVRNDNWPYNRHDPGHAGGEAVLAAIRAAVEEGKLEENLLED